MNKQITEDYVSFEVAKLLKEKGFNIPCRSYYNNNDYLSFEHPKGFVSVDSVYLLRPTHQMALKWLREAHNIFIEIKYVPNQFTDEPGYKAMIWDMSEEIGRPLPDDIEYAFYETCVNNALKYTLENLI